MGRISPSGHVLGRSGPRRAGMRPWWVNETRRISKCLLANYGSAAQSRQPGFIQTSSKTGFNVLAEGVSNGEVQIYSNQLEWKEWTTQKVRGTVIPY